MTAREARALTVLALGFGAAYLLAASAVAQFLRELRR